MSILRTAIATGALLIAIGGAAGSATADTGNYRAWSHACRHDALAFCRLHALAYDVPGVRDCLIRNVDKISDACRGVIRAAQVQSIPPPASATSH
jgi:hypothetical protein